MEENDAPPAAPQTGAETSLGEGIVGQGPAAQMGQDTILEKTYDFFRICDIENKGFISRRDMQRLNGELPLSPEELENVFESLDHDGNGFLTLEEFSSGFSEFLYGKRISVDEGMGDEGPCGSSPEALYQSEWDKKLAVCEEEEEGHFSLLMENLGANSVFEDPGEVRALWAQLRRDEPHLLSNFEDFLARVTSQIIEANQEKKEMESALQRKAASHDDEIRRLYEEMEQQIKNEKDKIVLQDYEQFLSRSQTLELQLSNKERELDTLFQKQRKLERQCSDLHSEKHMTKEENAKLKQTNDELAQELEDTSRELQLAQDQLSVLQGQSTRLHEEKEMEIYRLTEGLQRERASLLKQLDLLREMNKHLRDERDMCYQKPKSPLSSEVRYQGVNVNFKSEQQVQSQFCRQSPRSQQLPRIISIEEDHLPHLLQQQAPSQLEACSEVGAPEDEERKTGVPMRDARSLSSSGQQESEEGEVMSVALSHQSVDMEISQSEEAVSLPPDRLFKVILVGNSTVGKTSLLQRFCTDCFHSGTAATVGIDYSVKTIMVDNCQVALQMWDTAGQERYRSITKQFFRKADGVVVMYDITAESSFKSVRHWLTSVQECAGECIPILLLGNKTDIQDRRQIQRKMGKDMAKEYEIVFYECSALSGHNVNESVYHLAKLLKEQEDREKERTVDLEECEDSRQTLKKKGCC